MLIYKITNLITNKCYIGQTIKMPEDRWKEHLQHYEANSKNDKNKKLYQSMREYGVENFSFEVVQDNITNYQKLDEAEIYWIHYYNSFLDGYNGTRGGQRYHSYLPEISIIEDYKKTKSARKTAKNFGIDHSTVDRILNCNNIKRFSHSETMGKGIRIEKGDFSKEFNSVIECAKWFAEQNFCKTNNPESVRTSLKDVRRKNKTYYGFKIIEI